MLEYSLTSSVIAETIIIDDIRAFFKGIHQIQDKQNTLIIFDIDHVLIMPTKELTQNRHPFRKLLWGEITKNLPDSEIKLLTSIIKHRQEWEIVDRRILNIIDYLNKESIPTIALTTRGTGKLGILPNLEDKTEENLDKLGIKIPYPKPFHKKLKLCEFKNTNGMPVLQKGIISTSELNKGKILAEYLKRLDYIPNKIIFIDDKFENIESVKHMSEELNIEFDGYHYNGAKILIKNTSIDEEAERLRFQILANEHRWLSTVEAKKALKKLNESS